MERDPTWMGVALIAIGAGLLATVPFVARKVRQDPLGCLRAGWAPLGPRVGRAVGIAMAAIAGGFGLLFVSIGVRLLRAAS